MTNIPTKNTVTSLTPQQSKDLLNKGRSALHAQQVEQAVTIRRTLTQQAPGERSTWVFASQLSFQLRQYPQTLSHLNKALDFDPTDVGLRLQKTSVLIALNNIKDAKQLATNLLPDIDSDLSLLNELSLLLVRLHEYESALLVYNKMIALKADFSGFYYNKATTLRMLGRLSEAKTSIEKALQLNPNDAEAMQFRSSLYKQTIAHNHIDSLKDKLAQRTNTPKDKVHLCFGLSKELEDINDHQNAFDYLKQGADLQRSLLNYRVTDDVEMLAQIQQSFSANLFTNASEKTATYTNKKPIFILGLPRTGTTLVERILASHQQVFAAGELNFFKEALIQQVSQLPQTNPINGQEFFQQAAQLDFSVLGDEYLEKASPWLPETQYFIDKQPQNSLHVGLIHLALPQAKIIYVRRNPLDTCYAIYKNLFANAYPFSYNLDELAQYFIAHQQMMEHWQAQLGDNMLTVDYEDVVADVARQTRRLIDFCQLDWQDECLDFHNNTTYSSTASASQVKQPVYQSSVRLWQHYEQQLMPLISRFNDTGICLD